MIDRLILQGFVCFFNLFVFHQETLSFIFYSQMFFLYRLTDVSLDVDNRGRR